MVRVAAGPALSTDIALSISAMRCRSIGLSTFAAILERRRLGMEIANSNRDAHPATANVSTQRRQLQLRERNNLPERTVAIGKRVFVAEETMISSSDGGAVVTVQIA